MDVAFGFKAHLGWAALVVVGRRDRNLEVVERRRVALFADTWTLPPYHAAERLEPEAARALVERGVEVARRFALEGMRAAMERERDRGNTVAACAVLVGEPMPDWSVEEIRAVHFRMHKAEGVLFRDALVRAAEACGLRLVAIPEKRLPEQAEAAAGAPAGGLVKKAAALGKGLGPPWGKDQKDAALAALVALHARPGRAAG